MNWIKGFVLSFWKDDRLDRDYSPEFYHRGEKITSFLEKNLQEGEYAILRVSNYTFYYLKKEKVFLYDKHIILKGVLFSLLKRVSYFDSLDFLDKNPELKVLKIVMEKS